MRNLLLALFFILIAAPVYAADNTCQRHIESSGDYSLCPPDGWEIRPPGDSQYHSFFGKASGSLNPNINVYDETTDLPLKKYAEEGQKQAIKMALDAGFKRVDIVNQSDFVTHAEEKAIRTVYSSEFKGNQIVTVQYMFNGTRGRKIVVTCTVPESQKEKFMPICDQSLKTYRTDKKAGVK